MKFGLAAALVIIMTTPSLAVGPCEAFRNTDYQEWLACLRSDVKKLNLELDELVGTLSADRPDLASAQARWTEETHAKCRKRAMDYNNLEWRLLTCVQKLTRARIYDLKNNNGG